MKFKRILSLALASIFIISQAVIAVNKESFIHYTEYPKVAKSNDPVTIADLQLKADINKALDPSRKEEQDITKDEMESLKGLVNVLNDGTKYIISNLAGLEYAINLDFLFIFEILRIN